MAEEKAIKKIKQLLKEAKADIKKYHLKDFKFNYPEEEVKTADDVANIVNSDWSIEDEEDLMWICGGIAILERLWAELEK